MQRASAYLFYRKASPAKMHKMLVVGTIFALVLSANAQLSVPLPLWKWPYSSDSYLPYGPPESSNNAEYNGKSSCGGGGDLSLSWACPHQMLLSPDMLNAAKADGNDWALYGVVGIGQQSDCGKCFQLEITGAGAWPTGKTKYIVQAVNTGSDVSSGQFDIFIGAGGFGIYDACSSDCQSGQVCSGGHCNAPQYSGDFHAWTPSGNCYGGGVLDSDGCNKLVTTPSQSQNFAEKTLIYGCKAALEQNYHQNFQINYQQVQCPKSLYQMTGIRPRSDYLLRSPHNDLKLENQGRTTTMMDCCKPTCAWRQNVESYTDPNWPQAFACSKEGYPLINKSANATADTRL